MADSDYASARTGLLLVDPSNDFLASEGPRQGDVVIKEHGSTFAHAIVTTREIIADFSAA
jgi:hypothetical protein